jgi:hypothetical protein
MTVRRPHSHAPTTSPFGNRQARLRELNDGLRLYARAGIIFVTSGIRSLGEKRLEAVLEAVRSFDQFDRSNDPYEEHDLGVLKVAGERVMWKIDYYDRDRRFASSDPTDPTVTTRILTIMLASEY